NWLVGRSNGAPARSKRSSSIANDRPLPTVAVIVPVLNEAHVLDNSIRTLRTFLHERFPYSAHIVVVDNGSKDGTCDVALRLTAEIEDGRLVSLSVRERVRALRTVR